MTEQAGDTHRSRANGKWYFAVSYGLRLFLGDRFGKRRFVGPYDTKAEAVAAVADFNANL